MSEEEYTEVEARAKLCGYKWKQDMNSIGCALESMKNYTGGATNIRGFIITTLFNAASTADTYVGLRVNHALRVNEKKYGN